jgi:hypothetical protein
MLLTTLASASCAGGAGGSGGNLLAGRAPVRSRGVVGAGRLSDGRAAREGDFWKTELTTRFASEDAYLVYDLGARQPIAAAWLQGDNNDRYELAVSDDGQSFSPAWRAEPQPGTGLRERHTAELQAAGRYLRVSAVGGDGAFALSELQVFSDPHALGVPLAASGPQGALREAVPGLSGRPRGVELVAGTPLDQTVRDRVLLCGLALMALVVLATRGMPLPLLLILLAPAGGRGCCWRGLSSKPGLSARARSRWCAACWPRSPRWWCCARPTAPPGASPLTARWRWRCWG